MYDPTVIVQILSTGAMRGAMYALMGIGISLIFGTLRVVNFAQGEFYMLGGYLTYIFISLLGVHPILSILFSAILIFLVGMIIEMSLLDVLRARAGPTMDTFVITLGLSIAIQNIALAIWGGEYRGVSSLLAVGSITVLGATFGIERTLILVIGVLTTIVLWIFLKKTLIGKAMRAVPQNEAVAKIHGINEKNIYRLTFGLGVMISGIAGALLLPVTTVYPTVGINALLKGFTVVIIGGLGDIRGAVLGGFLLGLIESIIIFITGEGWQYVISLAIAMIILIIRPTGLLGVKMRMD